MKANAPLTAPAPRLAPTHRDTLQSELGEILLKSQRAINQATNIAEPTARWRGSQLSRTPARSGPKRPPTKNGHHRQNESFDFLARSVIRLTTQQHTLLDNGAI